jgi:hypothetical protein
MAFIIILPSYFLKSAPFTFRGFLLCYPYVLLSLIHIKRSTETEGIPSKVLRWKEYLDLSEKTSQDAANQNGEKHYDLSLAEIYEVDWIKEGKMGWACGAQESK